MRLIFGFSAIQWIITLIICVATSYYYVLEKFEITTILEALKITTVLEGHYSYFFFMFKEVLLTLFLPLLVNLLIIDKTFKLFKAKMLPFKLLFLNIIIFILFVFYFLEGVYFLNSPTIQDVGLGMGVAMFFILILLGIQILLWVLSIVYSHKLSKKLAKFKKT